MNNSVAVLEEFLQEKYVELYDKQQENDGNLSKIDLLQKYYSNYFYMPKDYGYGNLTYVINNDGKALYLLKKSGLPEEIQKVMKGGDDKGKTYTDFQSLNDVYGVTKDLKVYYSARSGENIFALNGSLELDNDNLQRKVFDGKGEDGYYGTLSNYDIDKNGELSLEEAKSIKSLTVNSESDIKSFSDLYNLVSLQKLVIDSKTLSNLNGIQNCPNLIYVYFKNVYISDYSALCELENRLQYLYFYNIDDDELSKCCDGMRNGNFSELRYLAVGGFSDWYEVNSGSKSMTCDNVSATMSLRGIKTLKPFESLTDTTKKAVRYLCINNNNISDENLNSLKDFTNLYLLRAEYNNIKSLMGLNNLRKLTYLYCCNNSLGTDCNEDGTDETKDCLSSLENKNIKNAGNVGNDKDGLFYVNLRDNINLRWVDYFSNDTDIKYLYLKGCSPNMNVNKISKIILNCENHYDLPCRFLSGTKYIWSDYFYTGSPVENKLELTATRLKNDLMENCTITHLNLSNCKTGKDDGEEITDLVLNEILKSMPQIEYVLLNGTNLKTLDFCKLDGGNENNSQDLANLHLYAFCPNLIELDLRNTYVTDISALNNIVKKTVKNPDGRVMGTLRLSKSLEKDSDGENKLVNLSSIQDVISGLTGAQAFSSSMEGLVFNDFETFKLLESCTNLTRVISWQWGLCVKSEKILDLSNLNKLTCMHLSGWSFEVKYPSKLNYLRGDQILPPNFESDTNLNYLYLNCAEWCLGKDFSSYWKPFFKSLEACESISDFNFGGGDNIDDSVFYDNYDVTDKKKEIFHGGKIKNMAITVNSENMGNVLRHLSDLKKLEVSVAVHFDPESIRSIFSNFDRMEELSITKWNDLVSLEGLENLKVLRKLVVKNTSISSCVPLKNMTNLTYLDLRNNAIGQMSDDEGISRANLDILYQLNPDVTRSDGNKGQLTTLYLQGNDGLKGIIDNHPILSLTWSNGKIWG